MSEKIRVLLAKPGLDGHDRGIKVIAAAFRDAGFEVIYTGLRQTPEQIATAAVQEDVDAVGVSILSGAHMTLFPAILKLLKDKGAESIMLFGGGIIPDDEVVELEKMGVAKLFTPGAATTDIVEWLRGAVAAVKKDEEIL
jgi:methylmalonyl-CoA mutase, C-terminal domain